MDFSTFDLETEPASSLRDQYDLVIGTNVVHATSNVLQNCSRLRTLLKDDGLLVLSEVTRIINWYDVVFGLLLGWWCATNGRDYPLQPPDFWRQALQDAGFCDCGISGGSSDEAQSQKIIVACKAPQALVANGYSENEFTPASTPEAYNSASLRNLDPKLGRDVNGEMSTVTYKQVGNLSIHADITYPSVEDRECSRPIGTSPRPRCRENVSLIFSSTNDTRWWPHDILQE